MSGLLIATLAGLMTQAAPHPSTQTLYEAPAIRPFEPTAGPDAPPPQGDDEPPPHRGPLAGPVAVGAYARSYEFSPTGPQAAYEQGVASAELRADQTAGPLDGFWRVRDETGQVLFDLVLADPGMGPVEGGWRDARESGAATAADGTVRLEGLGSLRLERDGRGWRGRLDRDGQVRTVSLSRPD